MIQIGFVKDERKFTCGSCGTKTAPQYYELTIERAGIKDPYRQVLCYYCLLKLSDVVGFFITSLKNWQSGKISQEKVLNGVKQFKRRTRKKIEVSNNKKKRRKI